MFLQSEHLLKSTSAVSCTLPLPPCLPFLPLGLRTQLFVKVPRPLDSEVTFSVSSQAAICYFQSNHSKVEAIPLSALTKDKKSELAGLSLYQPFKLPMHVNSGCLFNTGTKVNIMICTPIVDLREFLTTWSTSNYVYLNY